MWLNYVYMFIIIIIIIMCYLYYFYCVLLFLLLLLFIIIIITDFKIGWIIKGNIFKQGKFIKYHLMSCLLYI